MRILFLNLYFPPDTSATAKAAESMVHALAQTHEVTVLCGRPSYDPAERRPWKLWQTERITANIPHSAEQSSARATSQRVASFKIIRVGSTDYPRIQMNHRILNYLTFVKIAFWRALFIPCDAIFAMTDPPFNGIIGAYLSLLKRKPLIYDIQDMYPDMAVAGSIIEPGLLTRFWERLHRWALRRATRIIVLGDDMRARVISKAIDAARIFIVRSGVESPAAGSSTPPLNPAVTQAIRGNFRFVLLHAGNLGFYGAWETIIAAARQLQNENIGLVFVGDGAERSRLEKLAAGASNIHFLPFYSARDIPAVLAAPDAHIVTIKPGLEGVVVPSKMFGILAAGKPIIAVASQTTDVAALGVRHGFAICAHPADPDALASKIRSLASDTAALSAMRQAARQAAPQYSRAIELKSLIAIVEGSAHRPQP